ncbi:unnamed protein product, partial [Hapterophycus canaliculatus]
FTVVQIPEFELLLPSYYNHNKFLSFVRQLNFYGERNRSPRARLCRGMSHEFTHPRFRRGRRDLLADIKRQ